ncbi:MAG: 50S ribosomal protein L3 [Patescibacteria group bacterium]|jgi:large subunit ribosomal protein L3
MKFIIGRKLGMTRVFDDEGRSIPVTKVAVLPAVVSQVKTKDTDGYKSVQIKAYKFQGSEKVAKTSEFRVENPGRYKIGDKIGLKQFKKDEIVAVEGVSKGKGFAGTIKRHGFKRGPETHGSNNVREPGSIGGGYPQRVVLGRRMPGHMGHSTVTIKNLRIVDLDDEMILISGAIPGPVKSIIKVYGSGEVAEEEVDTEALLEKAAMEKMLEADAEAKEEKKADEAAPETAEVETEKSE